MRQPFDRVYKYFRLYWLPSIIAARHEKKNIYIAPLFTPCIHFYFFLISIYHIIKHVSKPYSSTNICLSVIT
ncbi:hypothetical protein BD408DRAFT_168166 [Parasitella parasitica]|nr:hypothetical protein BD408DRAFT_168166 [Parasitella parasitica]